MASLVKVLVHVVFSTKKRVPFIEPALRADLYPYLGGIVRHQRATLLAIGGMPARRKEFARISSAHA